MNLINLLFPLFVLSAPAETLEYNVISGECIGSAACTQPFTEIKITEFAKDQLELTKISPDDGASQNYILQNEKFGTVQAAISFDKDLKYVNYYRSSEVFGSSEYVYNRVTQNIYFYKLSPTDAVLVDGLSIIDSKGEMSFFQIKLKLQMK